MFLHYSCIYILLVSLVIKIFQLYLTIYQSNNLTYLLCDNIYFSNRVYIYLSTHSIECILMVRSNDEVTKNDESLLHWILVTSLL